MGGGGIKAGDKDCSGSRYWNGCRSREYGVSYFVTVLVQAVQPIVRTAL
jgi:hypothetical protein